MAVLSRVGLDAVETDLPTAPGFPEPDAAPEARYIAADCGGVRVACVYVPNGRTPLDPHYTYKLAWLAALGEHIAPAAAASTPFVIMGDFNVAPHDDDVWDMAAFTGSTHVTAPERSAVQTLIDHGLHDVMPTISKGPHPFTYWDYRAGMFHKGMGMRIDLVLANAALAGRITGAYVDREARKLGVKGTPAPSDHAPVVVDIQ